MGAAGAPEQIARNAKSYTGAYLRGAGEEDGEEGEGGGAVEGPRARRETVARSAG